MRGAFVHVIDDAGPDSDVGKSKAVEIGLQIR